MIGIVLWPLWIYWAKLTQMSRRRVQRLTLVVGGCMWRDGRPKDRAESLLLSWCKNAVRTLWLARWEVVGLLKGRFCVLIVVALALRREGETTGFVDVEEMALKFGKWWQSFVI